MQIDGWRDDATLHSAAYGTLGEFPQTVPRAELQAAVMALMQYGRTCQRLWLYSDCSYVVKMAKRPREVSLASGNADLWSDFWRWRDEATAEVTIVKVKAHAQAHPTDLLLTFLGQVELPH